MGPFSFSTAGLKAGRASSSSSSSSSSSGTEEKKSQSIQRQGNAIHSSRPALPMMASSTQPSYLMQATAQINPYSQATAQINPYSQATAQINPYSQPTAQINPYFQLAPYHPVVPQNPYLQPSTHIAPPSQPTDIATQSSAILPYLDEEHKRLFSNMLDNHGIDNANDSIELGQCIEGMMIELRALSVPLSLHLAVDELDSEIKKELQAVQTEALILKLLKKAAAAAGSTASALYKVGNLPLIKTQKTASEAFERSTSQFDNNSDLTAIDVTSELNKIQEAKLGAAEILEFFEVNIQGIRSSAVDLVAESTRMDKRNTGLPNTIIVDQKGNLITLKNSVNLRDEGEDATFRDQLSVKFEENFYGKVERPHRHPEKIGYVKAILGQGTFGKVRPGQDILTGKMLAVKKMSNIESAQKEVAVKDKLTQSLVGNSADIKYFLTADSLAIDNKRENGEEKAYVMSELQSGDASEVVHKIRRLKSTTDAVTFQKVHGKFIIQTLDTLQVLNRNGIIHADLKWDNIIGGKIADLDRLCYRFEDKMDCLIEEYTPPEIELATNSDGTILYSHKNQENYDKHTSFVFSQMLLETIDPESYQQFPLDRDEYGFATRGFSEETAVPDYNSKGEEFSPYEKDIIRLAYKLGDHNPSARPSMAEAKKMMEDIDCKHNPK